MKFSIVILILFIMIGCHKGDLGGDYYYLPDYEAVDIGYSYGSIIYKSTQQNTYNKVLIYADVIDCKYSSDYIIVLQRPNKALVKQNIKDDLKMWRYLSKITVGDKEIAMDNLKLRCASVEKISSIADSLFQESSYYQKMFHLESNYYIIDKDTDSIFGPMDKIQFEKMKEDKNISLDFYSLPKL